MRSILIFLVSAVLSAGVIFNAVVQKKQFYPSVVYISKSNPSMAVSFHLNFHSQVSSSKFLFFQVIYFQSLILVLMLGKLMRKVSSVAFA